MHGLDNLQNLLSVGAIRRFTVSFFANQKFSRDRKAELLCKSRALVFQVKFRFMGCLVKAKRPSMRKQIGSSLSSQLMVSLFLRNCHRREIFSKHVFASTFRTFLQLIKKTFRKFLAQKHPWRSLILVKL